MKVARISPFVVSPAPDNEGLEVSPVKHTVHKTAATDNETQDRDPDPNQAQSLMEFAKRKKEEQEKRNKRQSKMKLRVLKSYNATIDAEYGELMRDNFKRTA